MNERSIFLAALDLADAAKRSAYLDQACGGDAVLRRHIAELIAAESRVGDFLDRPRVEVEVTADLAPVAERPGGQIGHYKLLEQIGEGGFGVVFMAEQQHPVRRKVALKVLKAGMDTRQVIARFEAERQALALMDHPNIARVLDAGETSSGRPYFVMELVRGIPITQFCDETHLTTRERLELFINVCQAAQHAHQKGIIHRDIKPSNVLVTLHDGTPVVKVIDFGVAKATGQQLTEKTLFTGFAQMVGTPLYMSPEQAALSGLDIDTRSDVYSLGVLLYELLTGTTPLQSERLKQAAFDEIRRLIREEEPPKPSTRISTLGATATSISALRKTEPHKLSQLLRNELDWIVMKALEKDRTRRYETASAFAADVGRFLRDEQVEACPPSTWYRLRKFARRNRVAFTSGALVAGALLAGVAVSTALAVAAMRQRDRAELATIQMETSRREAETQRDQAERARVEETLQRQRAVEREFEAKLARTAEAEQRTAAERERDKANSLNQQLKSLTQEQRRTIYAAEMNLVRLEAQRSNLPGMRELLLRQVPRADQEDLRGFEWNYWYRFLHRGQIAQRFDEIASATLLQEIALTPGGELVACTRGGRTEIIEIATGNVRRSFPARPRAGDNPIAIDSRGQVVSGVASFLLAYSASRRPSQEVKGFDLWAENGEKKSFEYPPDTMTHVSNLAISPDGRLVAAIGLDPAHQGNAPATRILIWHVGTGELAHNWVESREFTRLQFSRDGRQLFVFLCHGTQKNLNQMRDVVAAFDTETRLAIGVARHDDDIDGVYCLPGGNAVLLSTLGWSGRNRMELYRWNIGDDAIRRLGTEFMPNWVKGAVSPDGGLFAVGSHTVPMVRLIDTKTGVVLNSLHNEATAVSSLAFAADGSRLVASGPSGVIVAWDLVQDEDLFRLRAEEVDTALVAMNDDLAWLLYRTRYGGVRLRSRAGEDRVLTPDGSREDRTSDGAPTTMAATFSSDGRLLAYLYNSDGYASAWWYDTNTPPTLKVYDITAGRELWSVRVPVARGGRVLRSSPLRRGGRLVRGEPLAISQNGGKVVVKTPNGVQTLDIATGQFSPPVLAPSDALEAVETGFVRQSTARLLLPWLTMTGEESVQLQVVDAVSGEVLGQAAGPRLPNVTQAVASPDARHIGLVRSGASVVEVWDLAEKRLKFTAPGSYVLFSADGDTAAAVEVTNETQRDQSDWLQERITNIGLWRVTAGQQQATVRLTGNRAEEVRFSPDGRRLLTLHGRRPMSGGAVPEGRLWDVATGQELMTIPVADVNNYTWDMAFQTDSTRLTTFVFAKKAGSGGGWGAVAYDARPLTEAEDSLLVARPLVSELFQRLVLLEDVVATLEADSSLRPGVRSAAISLARQRGDRVAEIADACTDMLLKADVNGGESSRVLRLAHVHQALRPDDPLAAVHVELAEYLATGNSEKLQAIREEASRSSRDNDEPTYIAERIRHQFLTIAHYRVGDIDKAFAHYVLAIKTARRILRANPEFIPKSFSSWIDVVSKLIEKYPARMDRAQFDVLDDDSNGKLTSAEFLSTNSVSGSSPVTSLLSRFDANGNGEIDFDEFLATRAAPTADDLKALDSAIALSPEKSALYAARGRVHLRNNDPDKAIADYDRAIQLNPQLSGAFNERGIAKSRKSEFAAAAADFTDAIRLDPRLGLAYISRAAVYSRQDRDDLAFADLNKALELDPQSVSAFSARSTLYRKQRKLESAIADLDRALEYAPEYRIASLYRSRADIWIVLAEYDVAISDLNRVLASDPADQHALTARGMCWMRKGDFTLALADFQSVVRSDPQSLPNHANLAAVCVLLGQLDQAHTEIEQALRFGAPPPPILFWRGLLREKQQRTDEAARDYENFITALPKPADAYRDRANRWANWGYLQRAIDDFTQALRIEPDDAASLMGRGKLYQQQGKYSLAREDFLDAVEVTPAAPDAHLALAWLLASCPDESIRDGNAAVAAARKACELTQNESSSALNGLAAALAQNGDFAAAAEQQTKAVALASPALRSRYQGRLSLYQKHQPFRETTPMPSAVSLLPPLAPKPQ